MYVVATDDDQSSAELSSKMCHFPNFLCVTTFLFPF